MSSAEKKDDETILKTIRTFPTIEDYAKTLGKKVEEIDEALYSIWKWDNVPKLTEEQLGALRRKLQKEDAERELKEAETRRQRREKYCRRCRRWSDQMGFRTECFGSFGCDCIKKGYPYLRCGSCLSKSHDYI